MRSHGIRCATLPRKPRFVNGRTLVLRVKYALRGGFGLGLRLIDGGLLRGLRELMPAGRCLLCVTGLRCRLRLALRILSACRPLRCLALRLALHCLLLHLPDALCLHHLRLLQLLGLGKLVRLHAVAGLALRLHFGLCQGGLLRLELLVGLGLCLPGLLCGDGLQVRLFLRLSGCDGLQAGLLLRLFLGLGPCFGFGFRPCLGLRLGFRFRLGACRFGSGLLCRFRLGSGLRLYLVDEGGCRE